MSWTWRGAFFRQAREDFRMAHELRQAWLKDSENTPDCHWIHYLQMATEKLARGYLAPVGGGKPKETHTGFVRFIQKAASRDRRLCSCLKLQKQDFPPYLRGLVPLADDVQNMAPALARDAPNPEYPWPDPKKGVQVPCEYTFSLSSPRGGPSLEKLWKFLRVCFKALSE